MEFGNSNVLSNQLLSVYAFEILAFATQASWTLAFAGKYCKNFVDVKKWNVGSDVDAQSCGLLALKNDACNPFIIILNNKYPKYCGCAKLGDGCTDVIANDGSDGTNEVHMKATTDTQ